jgi:hypothetical protein
MSDLGVKVHLDSNGNDLAVEHFQDVEAIIHNNKELQKERQTSDGFRHKASIPEVILVKWLDEEYARGNSTISWGSKEFDELIRRKLNDSEWAYLRTDNSAVQGFLGFGS